MTKKGSFYFENLFPTPTVLKPANKITKREWKPPIDFYQSELSRLASAIVHWPPLYSFTKHTRFCEPGVVTFSRRHLLFACRRTSRKLWEESWWGSSQLRMLTWFNVIWSLFQFLVIIDYFGGKKHIESTMLCYVLVKHERFCKPGIVTFSRPLTKLAHCHCVTFSVMGLSMCSSIFSESSPVRSKSGIINELSGLPNSVPTVRCSYTSFSWYGHTGHAYCIWFVGKH